MTRPAEPTPARRGHLALGAGLSLAWQSLGPTHGEPWLVLHGGPGAGAHEGLAAPLDLTRQRAILPDQRGSGASRPRGTTRAQTAATLVNDLERLRRHLGITRWSLLGGSWGATLALAYAGAHPQRVVRVVLRGAFALSRRELDGLFRPRTVYGKTIGPAPLSAPFDGGAPTALVLQRLGRLLQSATPSVASLRATRTWAWREQAMAERGARRTVLAARSAGDAVAARAAAAVWRGLHRAARRGRAWIGAPRLSRGDRRAWAKFRVQAAVLQGHAGLRPAALSRVPVSLARAGVPVDWVHGRFDAICPPAVSRRGVARALAHGGPAWLHLTLAGHLAHEPATATALRRVVRQAVDERAVGRPA